VIPTPSKVSARSVSNNPSASGRRADTAAAILADSIYSLTGLRNREGSSVLRA